MWREYEIRWWRPHATSLLRNLRAWAPVSITGAATDLIARYGHRVIR